MTTTRRTDATQEPRAARELGDGELEQIAGGALAVHRPVPGKWKMASFDGKGNDVVTEEISFVHEPIKRS